MNIFERTSLLNHYLVNKGINNFCKSAYMLHKINNTIPEFQKPIIQSTKY
jgi:hypothetical protein